MMIWTWHFIPFVVLNNVKFALSLTKFSTRYRTNLDNDPSRGRDKLRNSVRMLAPVFLSTWTTIDLMHLSRKQFPQTCSTLFIVLWRWTATFMFWWNAQKLSAYFSSFIRISDEIWPFFYEITTFSRSTNFQYHKIMRIMLEMKKKQQQQRTRKT